jgi:signal transduction histidine kinase
LSIRQGVFRHQTRMLLWGGFGGLLLLMAVVGVSALSFMYQIQKRQEKIRQDYVERDQTLEKIRSDIYISGTYVRDYLLDSTDEAAATHKAAFFEARDRIESRMRDYAHLVRPGEHAVFDQFRKEAGDYLATVGPALGWTADERRVRGVAFIDHEVLPRRMLAVDLTDRMHELTERHLEASSVEVSDLFSSFRTRLVLRLVFTLGIGLALAGSSLRRVLALERESEIRFQEILGAQEELKRLSAELLSAQENERRRISRELHDEVGQVLSAIMLGLGNLRSAIDNEDREEALSQLQLVQDMTQRNASVVRNISLLLRPTMLDDLGLLPALKWLAREVSRTSGIRVDVVVERAPEEIPEDLPEEHRTCIYRVVQEAVHNASRHSGAALIRIYLQQTSEGRLRVSVQDDGRGFEPFGGAGLGILGMEERILRLGGTMKVDSQPGGGTIISFDLPLPRQFDAGQLTRPLRTA